MRFGMSGADRLCQIDVAHLTEDLNRLHFTVIIYVVNVDYDSSGFNGQMNYIDGSFIQLA